MSEDATTQLYNDNGLTLKQEKLKLKGVTVGMTAQESLDLSWGDLMILIRKLQQVEFVNSGFLAVTISLILLIY